MLCAWAVGSSASSQVLFNETFTGGAPVAGFTNVQAAGSTPWSFNNPAGRIITGASFDSNFAIMDSDFAGAGGGAATAQLTSAPFDASVAGTYELDFSQQFRAGFGGVGAVEVFNGTTWTAVLNYAAASQGFPDPAVSTNVDITAATGGSAVARVRFTFSGDYAWWWAVDNIVVERFAPPACAVPLPSVSNVTATSVDVSWACPSCTGSYIVEYGAPGFTPGTAGVAGAGGTIWTGAPVAGSPVTITGLSSLTAYQVYVRQDCGGSLYSANSAVSNFTTACGGTTCDYVVRIGDIFGDGWDGSQWVVRQNGVVIATVGPQLTSGCGPVDIPVTVCEGATLELDWTVLGGFATEKALQFYDPFGVLIYDFRGTSTSVNCPGVNWTSANNVATTGLQFTTTANCTPPACVVPNTVTTANITANSADVNYLCASCTGPYIIEYGVAPFTTPGTGATAGVGGTVVNSATLSAALSGLASSTTYNVYVRQECDPGVLYSDNSFVATFTTLCGVATAPYTQGFEAFAATSNATWPLGSCLAANPQNTFAAFRWDRSTGITPSNFSTGPSGPHSGAVYAFTEASSGVAGAIATLDLQVVDVSSLTAPAMTFFYHRRGTGMGPLNVQASTDGVNYTTVFGLTGQQQTDAADPWLEAFVNLSAYAGESTLYIRFQAIRGVDFNGDMAIDEINIVEGPTCFAPSNLAIGSATLTSVTATWTADPNAGGYNWEVRTFGDAGSGPSGLVDAGTTASNTFTSTLLTANTTYQVYVQSDCSANSDGLSTWTGPLSVFTGYCIPTTNGNLDPNGITNVTFANVDEDMNTAAASGYIDNSAIVGAVGGAGDVVPLSVLVQTGFSYDMFVWIDWNNNLVFDNPAELVAGGVGSEADGTNPWVTSFTVPGTQAAGNYRMRIGGADFGVTGPCFSGSWLAFTDFTISICEPPTATASVNDDCVAQTFTVTVTATDLGSGSNTEIVYSVDGVPQTPVAYVGPSTDLPAVAVGSTVVASLVNDDGCLLELGSFFSNCPIELDCGGAPVVQSHCYDTGDTRTWTFVNPDPLGTVAVRFLSGEIEATDEIVVWDGAIGGTALGNLNGDLTNLSLTSTGNSLSISFVTDGSGSCVEGTPGLAAGIVFQARCGGCSEPQGFVTYSEDDLGFPTIDCDAVPATFNPWVGIAEGGFDPVADEEATEAGYRLFVNGVQQADVTGLAVGDFYDLGTFPLGTELDVILLHVSTSACNNTIETEFTAPFSECPPANDLCENAEVLTLNPDGTCPANAIVGTTVGADQTGPLPECQASGDAQDVWYTFNSGTASSFTLTLTAGTAGNVGVQLFTECGTPAPGACLANILPANNPITVTVLPGTDYRLRVFTNVSTGAPGTFNICVSAFDPCLDIQNIAGCAVSTQAARPAGVGAWTGYGGPFATPGRERIFTFTPTITGLHNLEVTNVTGSWVDFFYKPSSAGCNSVGWIYIDDVIGAQSGPSFAMTAGTEYYIMWDAEDQTTARDVTFSISCPLLPPANDDCAGAIALTVNGATACTVQTNGTLGGATASAEAAPSCGNANDDVWYSFVATAASHTVALNNVSGFTDMAFTVYTGACGGLTQVVCSDPNTTTLTGLTIGATYLVRVYSFGLTAGLTTTFDICVSTPPVPGSECNGAIAIGTFPVVNQALVCTGAALPGLLNATNVPATCGTASNSYKGGEEALYTFVAPTTDNYLISIAGQTWTSIFVYSGACPTNGGVCVGSVGTSASSKSLAVPMTAGVTYYIWFDVFPAPNSPCPGTFSLDLVPPPPANDDCSGAVALTVNPDFGCGVVTAGTNVSSTPSAQPSTGISGTANTDVWYTFVATNPSHRISLLNIVAQGGAFNSTDMGMALYTGSAGACSGNTLTFVGTSDPETWNVTGLSVGTTYYLRVYGWSSSITLQNFNVCIGTPPPPPANDDCAGAVTLPVSTGLTCAAQTAGTLQSATNSGIAVAPCTGVVNDDVWYSFTATSTQHIITLSDVAPVTTMRMQLFSGVCGTLTHLSCSTVNSYTTPNTLVAGQTYYLRVYSLGSTAVGTTFNICVTTPPAGPPVNDNCAGALNVPVNAGQTCTTQTFGTVFGATASGNPVTPCFGTADDDVWFSFVATGPTHTVSLNSVTGSVTSMNFNVFSGACGTLTNIGCGATGIAPSTAVTGLTPGTTYFVRVYTNTATGGQNTTFNVCVTSPPANDLCANAIAVGCNSITAGTTVGSTLTGAPPTCVTTLNTAGGVWYTVQGWGGTMTASLCSGSFDTKIGVFTGSCGTFTCVNGNDDDAGTGGAGVCGGGTRSSTSWASVAGTTYYIYVTGFSTNVGTFDLTVSCGSTNATCTGANGLSLEFQTDATPGQTTWQIRNSAGTVVAVSGGPLVAPSGIQTQALCLPDGCYTLRVLDSAGDGIANGGYILREAGPVSLDTRIIDNFRNFSSGSVSAIGNGPSAFCLPIGELKPIFVARDKLDWVSNEFFVCEPDEAVSAEWIPGAPNSAQSSTTGYQFWFFDPNGTYSFRRGRYHNTSDGFGPANEFRACHMRINNWAVANQIPENVLMNVRVRTRVNSVYGEFGPAYQFKIDPVAAACPTTKLNDIPNQPALSCNQTRNWGPGNFVHARQVSGANRYQFRFRIPAEGFIKVVTSNTYFQQLNWATAPLEAGKTYEVQVRASKDGGATWCYSGAVWGPSCTLTINTPAQGDEQNLGIANGSNSGLAMWPNPNRGDQLWIDLSGIEAGVETVSVDIMDMTGKQIVARILPTQGDRLNTVLNLNGDLATGMYLVNITAGDKRYTERLVIAN